MMDNSRFSPGGNRPNSNGLQMLDTPTARDRRKLKTIVFTIVMLSAVAVAAYTLIYKEYDAASCGTSSADYGGIYGTPVLADEIGFYEFAIIALAEAGMEFPEEMNDAVVEVGATAKASGNRTIIVWLNPDDERFAPVVEQYMIGRFPAVLVMGFYSYTVIYQDEISEASLMEAYEQAMSDNAENVSEDSAGEEI